MTKSSFKEAFKRGLGSAYLELKSCESPEKFKDIVLWCCLHNTCYDMQCEGGRGVYLHDAINLFEDKTFFEEAIIRQFMKKKLDTWLFSQLCELLYLFAMDGNSNARIALYKKHEVLYEFLSNKRNFGSICTERDNFEWLSVWLTSLDGFRAFKAIVELLGEFLDSTENSNAFTFDWFYSNAKSKFGEKRVDSYLQNNAAKSNAVKAFLKETSIFESRQLQHNASPTLNDLIEACNEPKGYRERGVALRFAGTASKEELRELAQIATRETDLEKKLGLLWPFRKVPFPLDENLIFELAEADDEAILEISFEMMKHLSTDRIHDYAVNCIKQKEEIVNSLSLLCCCYKPEDEALLVDAVMNLKVTYDDGGWHKVFMDVEDLLGKYKHKLNPELLRHMYRQTLCSQCRSSLVQIMSKRGVLPNDILVECCYDSYDDTRKLAASYLRDCE